MPEEPAWPGLPQRFAQDFAFRLKPLPDELLSSWLVRLAHAHGAGAHVFCALHWPGLAVWNRDIDRCAPAGWQEDLAGRTRTDAATVQQTTLQPLMPWLARDRPSPMDGMGPITGDIPLLLSAGIFHRSRTRHGLQYCPECLGQGQPYYRRSWRLGFSVCCQVHDRLLLDGCPACDAPVVPHRTEPGKMALCHACKDSLTAAGTPEAISGGTVAKALQASLLTRLQDGEKVMLAGEHGWASGPDAFAILRILVAVTTAPGFFRRLQERLGCQQERPGGSALVFEHSRTAVRLAWMELLARWTAGWPDGFIPAAADAGITRRSFARHRLPAALAILVRELPEGIQRRRRPWETILDDALMRRLRRTNKPAWRQMHAQRILAGKAMMPGDDGAPA